jgi:hypothetical protein
MIRPACCAAIAAIATFATSPLSEAAEVRLLELDLGEKGRMKQTVVATRESVRNGESDIVKMETTYDLEYALDDDDETYTVRKNLAGFKILEPKEGLGEVHMEVLTTLAGSVSNISFSADDSLSPLEIKDWDGLKRSMFEAIRKQFASVDAAEVEGVLKGMDMLYAQLTPESAAQLFLPLDQLMSIPHNVGLILKQPVVADSQVEASFGDFMLDAKEKLELTAWDERRNRAHVVYDFAPTPQSMRTYITDFLPKLMRTMGLPEEEVAGLGKQFKEGAADAIMSISTRCDYDIAIDTGLVASGICTSTRSVNLQGESNKKIDRYEFSEAFAK